MRRFLLISITVIIANLLLVACDSTKYLNLPSNNISNVMITTMPQSEEYSRVYTSADKIKKVIDYFNDLSLKDEFPENPDEYNGMTYIITVNYVDKNKSVFYHFGNMFLRENNDEWKRMNYDEASKLDDIVQNNISH